MLLFQIVLANLKYKIITLTAEIWCWYLYILCINQLS